MSRHPEHVAAHIVVGVANLRHALDFWCHQLGFEVVADCMSPDSALAAVWGLPSQSIRAQALIRTPETASGWLHLVEFSEPAAPVRKAAQPIDLCPKNLDINCTDIDARVAELQVAGHTFSSAVSDYEVGDIRAREVQMPGHDATNVVLIEIFDWPVHLTKAHYGGVASFVIVVDDMDAEAAFYQRLLGLEPLLEQRITGPEIEQVVGLPPGSALDMRVLGDPDHIFGRIELIHYENLSGVNRFPAARAPATGTLGCRFMTSDADQFSAVAEASAHPVHDYGARDFVFGRCRVMAVYTPAGMRIEVFQPLD